MLNIIIKDILSAVFQPFWFCMLLSFLFMFAYKQFSSLREAAKQWFLWFRTERDFRRMFLLAFYVSLVLCRTLLNRGIREDPLGKLWGSWLIPSLLAGDAKHTREAFENLIMLIPFTYLLLWVKGNQILKRHTLGEIIQKSVLLGFSFSFIIELLQLILFLGTFQISDLVQNTLGGILGGLLYWILEKRKLKKQRRLNADEKA